MWTKKNKTILGIIIMVMSATCWALMSILVKIATISVSTNIIVFSRFFVGLLFIMPWVLLHLKESVIVSRPMPIFARSFVTFGVTFCFYYSLRYIPVENALVLNNTFPLFIPIIISLTTPKSSTTITTWISLIIGFLGVLLVIKPTVTIVNHASFMALLSGILAAVSIVIIRSLALSLSLVQILFYNFLIGTIGAGIFIYFYGFIFSSNAILILLGIGIISTIYQFFLTYALRLISPKVVSPLTYLSIPVGILGEWIIWGKIPNVLTLIGIFLIIMGGIGTIWFEEISNKTE